MMRFLKAILQKRSIYRELFHDVLESMPESTVREILDIGGVKTPQPGYATRLLAKRTGAHVTTLNISAKVGADIVGDAEALAVGDATYDEVWCFNLLEHVAHPDRVVNEAYRVLKSGASFIGVMPFIHAIHGEPDDHVRLTSSGLELLFKNAGFKVEQCVSLGFGPYTAAFALTQFYQSRIVALSAFALARSLDAILLLMRPSWKERWPLGYFWVIRK